MKYLKPFSESLNSMDYNLIFDIFNDIKDELDLYEINIDELITYTANHYLQPESFRNSYYLGTPNSISNTTSCSIFYKSEKVMPNDPMFISDGKSNTASPNVEELLKLEYPNIYNQIINFVDSVKMMEMVDCYWYANLRRGSTFTYYHIYIGFSLKNDYSLKSKINWNSKRTH